MKPLHRFRAPLIIALSLVLAACATTKAATDTPSSGRPVATVAPGQLGVFYSAAAYALPTPGQTVSGPTNSKLVALRASDGTQAWSTALSQAYTGLTVAGGIVYGALVTPPTSSTVAQSTLVAYRTRDGGKAWTKTSSAVTVPVAADDSALYAVSYPSTGAEADISLVALRDSDGRQLWTADVGGVLQGGPSQTVVEANGTLYFVAGSAPHAAGSSPQYEVVALRASDGTKQWSASLSPPISDRITSFILAGSTLYVAGGFLPPTSSNIPEVPTVVALRASDGSRLWMHQFTSPLPTGQISLVATDSGVFVSLMLQPQGTTTAQGGMLAALSPQSGTQLWSATLAGPALTLVADANAVYVATGLPGTPSPTTIAAYKASDGAELWSQPVQTGFPSVAATSDGSLIAATVTLGDQSSGTTVLKALRTSDGAMQWNVSVDGQLSGALVAPF